MSSPPLCFPLRSFGQVLFSFNSFPLILVTRTTATTTTFIITEALPGGGGSHVSHLNFKTSRVGVYKCLLLIVTVAIWLREVVSCHNFILRAVATFWAMSLVGIYPGRTSLHPTRECYIFAIANGKKRRNCFSDTL